MRVNSWTAKTPPPAPWKTSYFLDVDERANFSHNLRLSSVKITQKQDMRREKKNFDSFVFRKLFGGLKTKPGTVKHNTLKDVAVLSLILRSANVIIPVMTIYIAHCYNYHRQVIHYCTAAAQLVRRYIAGI